MATICITLSEAAAAEAEANAKELGYASASDWAFEWLRNTCVGIAERKAAEAATSASAATAATFGESGRERKDREEREEREAAEKKAEADRAKLAIDVPSVP